jgi:hypothetical protein
MIWASAVYMVVYMFWLRGEDVSLMRWNEVQQGSGGMWGTCVWGWRVNMGMDSSEVIKLGLKWINTWPNKFVVLVMIEWGQERLWEQRSIGHDCMIEYYGVYYTMSYDKAIAWLYCRRTCNQTLSQAISIHVYTCTAILLFCAMILQAYIMLLCMRDVCNSEWFIRCCY